MADIRIKDLTTTASSSASDDFIAVDGTTNGTRKLNAFSPTFGGNATVTGTLTTVGATGSFGSSSSAGTSLKVISGVGTLASPKYSTLDFRTYNDSASGAYIRTGNRQSDTAAFELEIATRSNSDVLTQIATFSDSKLSILATTASTTTSSGALVVGNGTSGGLGVGGAASIGGPILVGTSSDVYVSRVGTGILDIRSASSPGTTARLDVTGTTSAGVGFRQSGARDWFISAESNELRVSCLTAASIFAFNSGTPVAMRDTTASTSTSSGALVVSGGVGVAGAVNAGTFYGLVDGVTAPATESGYARIYVDSADGDLKVKFGDGTVKTIATDS